MRISDDIADCLSRKQPVLVGTTSIETSEYLSQLLSKKGIEHQVLNAKFHEKEAQIIAHAGRPGTVTVATNMAGRGTDIVLGGSLDAELKDLPEDTPESGRSQIRQQWQERHERAAARKDMFSSHGEVQIRRSNDPRREHTPRSMGNSTTWGMHHPLAARRSAHEALSAGEGTHDAKARGAPARTAAVKQL